MDSTAPTLLIVEDNEDLRAVAREALVSEGYRVHAVPRAEAALRLFEEEGHSIDLVLTSVFLPGMTGIDLANRLREEGRNVRIVLTSSQAHQPDLQDRLARGDVEFLTRPFSLGGLTAKINQSLRRPEPELDATRSLEEPPGRATSGGFLRRLLGGDDLI